MPDEAIRCDRATIELVESTDEFMGFKVALAQPGVYSYEYPDGKILREAKLPEDLFREETIASVKGIPATLDHPPGLVTKDNYKEYAKGAFSDPRVEDEILWADETVWAPELMEALKLKKKIEVSLGQRVTMVRTPGTYNGEPYDVRQTNIIFNHVAHVDKGRLGSDMRVYLDSAGSKISDIAYSIEPKNETRKEEGEQMDLSWVDAMKKSLASLVSTKPEEQAKKNDEAPQGTETKKTDGEKPKEVKSDSEDVASLKSQLALYEDLVKSLKAMLEQALSPVTQDALAAKRMTLTDSVRASDPSVKLDGMSERQIKLHVISKVMPFEESVKLDSVTAESVDSRYLACLELARQKALIGETSSNQRDVKNDSASEIEKLKAARLNVKEMK